MPEIVQREAGQHDREPGQPNGPAAEVAHVGIHRLAAGHGQEYRAQDGEAGRWRCVQEVGQGVKRADGGEHLRLARDTAEAEDGEHHEPGEHHRSEDAADEPCPAPLHEEQADQDGEGEGHHRRGEPGRVDLEALDRAQHRDRRRDRPVAIEQRRSDQAKDQKRAAPAARRGVAHAEDGKHRDDAALPAIVGAQDQDRVFERDDDDERPQDERENAENSLRRGRVASRGSPGRFPEGVERAGADVAIDDAKRAQSCHSMQRAPSALLTYRYRPSALVHQRKSAAAMPPREYGGTRSRFNDPRLASIAPALVALARICDQSSLASCTGEAAAARPRRSMATA